MKVDLPLPLSIVVHFRTSFTVKTVWQLFVLLNHEIMSILANLIGLWKLSCFVMTAPKEEQLRNFQRALCASHARKSLVKGERFIRRLHGKHARKSNHVNFNTYLCVSCQPLSLVKLPFFQNARSFWHHGLVATLCYRAFFGPTEMVFVTDLENRTLSHQGERPDQPTSETHLLLKWIKQY